MRTPRPPASDRPGWTTRRSPPTRPRHAARHPMAWRGNAPSRSASPRVQGSWTSPMVMTVRSGASLRRTEERGRPPRGRGRGRSRPRRRRRSSCLRHLAQLPHQRGRCDGARWVVGQSQDEDVRGAAVAPCVADRRAQRTGSGHRRIAGGIGTPSASRPGRLAWAHRCPSTAGGAGPRRGRREEQGEEDRFAAGREQHLAGVGRQTPAGEVARGRGRGASGRRRSHRRRCGARRPAAGRARKSGHGQP